MSAYRSSDYAWPFIAAFGVVCCLFIIYMGV